MGSAKKYGLAFAVTVVSVLVYKNFLQKFLPAQFQI